MLKCHPAEKQIQKGKTIGSDVRFWTLFRKDIPPDPDRMWRFIFRFGYESTSAFYFQTIDPAFVALPGVWVRQLELKGDN
jgi:hypothetical protein